MKTVRKIIITGICLTLITGCISYRNTSLDHRLPEFTSPELDLTGLKSVQTRKDQNPEIAFALAISGGGHRAANFATGILLGLESTPIPDTNRNMLQEIDYFSTVSGGGFAVGTYISELYDHMNKNKAHSFKFKDTFMAKKERALLNLRRDYQNAVLLQWMHWRCIGYKDAGDLMEYRFDRYLLGSKYRAKKQSLLLGDIFKPSNSDESVRLPYWITNATVYENGARFMFVPQFIEHYQLDRYVHNMQYHNINNDPLSLPLSVGMKTSASFPVLFPATTFTCSPEKDKLNPYLHLIDGGLTDNLGVKTAIELLNKDSAKRKVLLVIDAYAKSSHPYSAHKTSPDGPGVAYRIMKIGLDGDHLRSRREVTRLAKENNIDVVFFDFDKLSPILKESMDDLKTEIANMKKKERESLSRRLRRELDFAMHKKTIELDAIRTESDIISEDAKQVATSLSITRAEQSVLFKAGQAIVAKDQATLTKLLKP